MAYKAAETPEVPRNERVERAREGEGAFSDFDELNLGA